MDINKQINDKERVAAAIENVNIQRILERGFRGSERMDVVNMLELIDRK